jgi:type VI secretion system secreted protein VgrG
MALAMPTADRFLFEVTGLSQELRVVRFTGHEGLSELFRFDVILAAEDAAVSFDDVVGHPALLTMQGAAGEDARYVHGMVARFRQGDYGKKLTTYHVTVVPRPSRLLHRHDCRIFQAMTAPVVIQKVLEGAGLASGTDFRVALQGTYATRDYCVQYRESDWAFVCRLMEEEGIHYFFEHEADKHVLVLGDKPAVHAVIPGEATVPFRAPLGAMVESEHVSRFHYAEEIRTGAVTLRDYDFTKPGLLLESKAKGSAFADLESYDHPGDYEVATTGDALAAVRLQERAALRKHGDGESGCDRLVAGSRFTLGDHLREAFNREWLITRVEHRGVDPRLSGAGPDGEISYENRFEVIPSDVPFRPPMITPRPTIKGVQSAIVTGPAGEEIFTDEYGRVKVQFHWDRLGKNDDKSSCWIRVSQGWAGEGWGAMFLPRINQEVLVDFLDGDPDRPIVVGRVYHGTNVPPYALPANKTRSTIKSNSTPGGGGSNELRFEDKKGSEEVYLHGQKDWTIAIENDKNQTVGHDETLSVTHNRSADVGNDQRETIGHDETFEVKNDRAKTVGHDEAEKIAHDRTIEVGNDHTESIGGAMSLSVAKAKTESVTENSGESVGKARTLSVGTDYSIDVSGNMSTTVGSNQSEKVELEKTLEVGSKLTIKVGDATVTIEKNGDVTVQGANLSVKTTGDVKVESSGKVDVKASGDVNVEASGKVAVKSSGTMDVNASGAVKLKGASVGIN